MRGHALLWVVSIGLLSSCAVGPGRTYSPWHSRTPFTVEDATVVEVHPAVLEGYATGTGVLGGGFIGGSIGNAVGSGGAGTGIATALLSVVGAVAGEQVEKSARAQKAWEILVRMDQGRDTLAIVQPADSEFAPGEKVHVYTHPDGSARVVKL